MPCTRKRRANVPVLLTKILQIIGHKWLCRTFTDFGFVFRIEQHCAIGLGWGDERNSLDKDRPPIDRAHGHRRASLFLAPWRHGHGQRGLTIAILQDDMRSGNRGTSVTMGKPTALRAQIG